MMLTGNPLDQMWSDVTVDTKAPEADVAISTGNNTSVYQNADGAYIATALEPGPATLKVTGVPGSGDSNYVGEGYGYLLYQIIGLNEDGTPYMGEASLQRPNTWMPLTPEATMLASTVWDQAIEQLVGQGMLPEELDLSAAGLGVMPTENLTLDLREFGITCSCNTARTWNYRERSRAWLTQLNPWKTS